MSMENNVRELGNGTWFIQVYTPERVLGPIDGILQITKEHYAVYDYTENLNAKNYLIAVPSQNVAYVNNKNVVSEKPKENRNKPAKHPKSTR